MKEKWINYFLKIAYDASALSTCRKHVGAVLVDPKTNYIISTGYNGAPSGITSCKEKGFCYREKHKIPSGTDYTNKCLSIHAEDNCILQAGIKHTEGAFLFIVGQPFICNNCKRIITQARIAMVYLQESPDKPVQLIYRLDIMKDLEKMLR